VFESDRSYAYANRVPGKLVLSQEDKIFLNKAESGDAESQTAGIKANAINNLLVKGYGQKLPHDKLVS